MIETVAVLLLVLGGFICIVNFYLSFLRYPVWLWRKKPAADYRWASGFPLVGSLLVAIGLGLARGPEALLIGGLILVAIDTGGLHWAVGTILYRRFQNPERK